MNINQIIESGVLESYALGLATAEETIQVETALANNPALANELAIIQDSLESYALANAITPPKHLKNKVMEALAKETQEKPIVKIGQQNWLQNLPTWQVAAAFAALILSLVGNLSLYQTLQTSNAKLSNLEAENTKIAQGLEIQKASYQSLSNELTLVQNPTVKTIILAGTAAWPDAKAKVYWSANKQEVYLSGLNLPTITAQQQYQLWAIVDGKPIDAGIFDLQSGMLKLKNIGKAQAFAISLEAKGGSTTAIGPKGAIYALGKV